MQIIKNKYVQYILVGVLFALPVLLPGISTAFVTLAGSVVYLAIAGLGFNVLLGYSGQISLGHSAFMGLAAYTSAYLTEQIGLPFLLSAVISVIAPFLIGLVLGAVAVRLEGFYLAIATLGFGEILRLIFIEADWFTGGFSGVRASNPVILGVKLSKNATYLFMVVIMTLLIIVVHNMINSHTGRALVAMKNSQHAAMAMGINIFRYKLVAFSVSSLFAGVAGVCYVHFIRYSDPTVWTSMLSLNLIAQVVIGGISTIGGAVLGAVVMRGLPEVFKNIPVLGQISGLPTLVFGILMIIILMFYSKGLIHIPGSIGMILTKGRNKDKKEV